MSPIEHAMGEVIIFVVPIERSTSCLVCRIKHIEKAHEANAIELLMVTDELFR